MAAPSRSLPNRPPATTLGTDQRRQLPQALLPPEAAHHETEAPLRQIREIPLVRSAVPNKDGDADAGDHQQPEDRRQPTRVGQELDHIGNWVLGASEVFFLALHVVVTGNDPGG